MIEALWTFEFISNENVFGTGVVVLESGRIFGGDSQYYFIGSYAVDRGQITAEIESTHYGGAPYSLFGPARHLNLSLSGQLGNPVIELRGKLVEAPEKQIRVRLTRREELP